jgi:hypothetical protein
MFNKFEVTLFKIKEFEIFTCFELRRRNFICQKILLNKFLNKEYVSIIKTNYTKSHL